MIDLRYNLSMLAYKLKDKLNRKKGHNEEDLDEPDFRTDFTSDEDTDQPLSDIDEETPEDGDLIIPDDEEDEGSQAKMLRRKHILLAAGSILFIGAGAMAYSSLNPTTASGKESKKLYPRMSPRHRIRTFRPSTATSLNIRRMPRPVKTERRRQQLPKMGSLFLPLPAMETALLPLHRPGHPVRHQTALIMLSRLFPVHRHRVHQPPLLLLPQRRGQQLR